MNVSRNEKPTAPEKLVNDVFTWSLGSVLLFVGLIVIITFLLASAREGNSDTIFSPETALIFLAGPIMFIASLVMWGIGLKRYFKVKKMEDIDGNLTGKLKASGYLLITYWVIIGVTWLSVASS